MSGAELCGEAEASSRVGAPGVETEASKGALGTEAEGEAPVSEDEGLSWFEGLVCSGADGSLPGSAMGSPEEPGLEPDPDTSSSAPVPFSPVPSPVLGSEPVPKSGLVVAGVVEVGSGVSVDVGSGVAVGSGVGVDVGSGVAVRTGPGVDVGFDVAVGSGSGVDVGFGVAVGSGMGVGVGVGSAVGAGVGAAVGSGVALGLTLAPRMILPWVLAERTPVTTNIWSSA